MSTEYSIALRTVHRIPVVTECCTKARPVGAGCFAMETTTILLAKTPRQSPPRKIFHLNTQVYWSGIEAGIRTALKTGSRTILYSPCTVTAKTFGPTRRPTTTCGDSARDGNEPHLLGHESLYLSSGGERRVFGYDQGVANENAKARRPVVDLHNLPWGSVG